MSKPATNETSDQALVEEMAAGQVEALRALNRRFGSMIFAIARKMLNDDGDAEEVAADAMWQAWRGAATYDPARGPVAAWLVTVTRSRAIDKLRARQSRNPPPVQVPAEDPTPTPAEKLGNLQRDQMLRGAVASLQKKERTLLEMAYFSEMSQSEIAQALKLPLGTVKTRIRAAMVKLRKELDGMRAAGVI